MRAKLALVALPAVLALAVGLTACGDDEPDVKTLKFTEREGGEESFAFVDNPPKSKSKGEPELSRGDQLSFTSDILDSSKKDVGDLDATCFVTITEGSFEGSRAQCTGTLTLKKGTLVLSVGGKAFGEEDTAGAIVGGTGAYEGATGSFTSTGDDGPSRSTYRVILP